MVIWLVPPSAISREAAALLEDALFLKELTHLLHMPLFAREQLDLKHQQWAATKGTPPHTQIT